MDRDRVKLISFRFRIKVQVWFSPRVKTVMVRVWFGVRFRFSVRVKFSSRVNTVLGLVSG